MQAVCLILFFLILIVLSVPISFAVGLATFLALLVGQYDFITITGTLAQRTIVAVDSFPLLAIPFFILSGELMARGGIARRLIDLAQVFVGRFTGGLGHVNVFSCMLFGSISGSAAAAASTIGPATVPIMEEEGYDRDFGTALTMCSATLGLIIPPSNIMIIYCLVASTSVAAMFVSGYLPGLIMGLGLMAVTWFFSSKRKYGKVTKISFKEAIRRIQRSILSLLLVIIVIGGILGGFFTATEASAVAVIYAFILSVLVYKEISLKELPKIFLSCAITTAFFMFLIGTSKALGWLISDLHLPEKLSAAMLSISQNKYVILLLINIILLVIGTFMDMTPAVLIFTPIFLPVVTSPEIGLHPLHFGIMMIANLCIGLCTPPVGSMLFVGCAVTKTTITRVIPHLLPMFVVMIICLLFITYLPSNIILFFTRLLGL
jgi:tripartite ATP-independent transporter DctM subunit